ncbi:PEP/pyruvate-binding domain-containing protein [Catellatospora chokoriensis]|uniref:Pyruvate, phosphate dikinase n=1 Tax=Catellatospora chokoriensis TaxID=310353 RepID=A0A8J3KBT7_9ACTN|nr:PEP/pyruvate-binding domain-containing protein [Catellatospora chokoriensis]GIF93079.1 pyruvate, phosphate dikinase [Catellatospora chokoriensis]
MADSRSWLIDLADAASARDRVGGKATVLAELAAAGLAVPPGFVVTVEALSAADLDVALADAAGRCGGGRFAVRSSGAAEDLPDASYAGLYETFLNVASDGLADAVRRCFAAAGSDRVRAYHDRRAQPDGEVAMAVLVQSMVDAASAGVAFTAHPVTGARDQVVVTAVAGLGESLVSGEQTGEEWAVVSGRAVRTRVASDPAGVLNPGQAAEVADLAERVAAHYGRPQDIEWAIDGAERLWLLQARPMTALPDAVSWDPPGPGLWMRNFRLGEWLPEAVTPLFGTWLLPEIEGGYLDGMHTTIGVRVPFRWALVNDWYYTATPVPSPRLLATVIVRGRVRAMKTLFYALIQVGRDPAAADRKVLSGLHRYWRDVQLPCYRALVAAAQAEVDTAAPARLAQVAAAIAREAGTYMWLLAIVGGSAWKMEARLGRFCRKHLAGVLDPVGGVQVLLRGLPGTEPAAPTGHEVQSLDWYHPIAAELPPIGADQAAVGTRHQELADERAAAEATCRGVLADRPRLLAAFDALLRVAQRYAVIREEQARDFTVGWPVLRACAARIGQHLADRNVFENPQDVHFCARDEVAAAIAAAPAHLAAPASARQATWEQRRRLAAPVTLGRAPRLIGDLIDNAVRAARSSEPGPDAIAGHPASAGRATGPVRIVHGPADFAAFTQGEVLVARATSPAWTPLFARAAAVVTDGGTLAAHASLVAREYGIPAVVGTGEATMRLRDGQIVTVDGTAGSVTISA